VHTGLPAGVGRWPRTRCDRLSQGEWIIAVSAGARDRRPRPQARQRAPARERRGTGWRLRRFPRPRRPLHPPMTRRCRQV